MLFTPSLGPDERKLAGWGLWLFIIVKTFAHPLGVVAGAPGAAACTAAAAAGVDIAGVAAPPPSSASPPTRRGPF